MIGERSSIDGTQSTGEQAAFDGTFCAQRRLFDIEPTVYEKPRKSLDI
jgi:hypothetical protein